jgi:hypothetical protein
MKNNENLFMSMRKRNFWLTDLETRIQVKKSDTAITKQLHNFTRIVGFITSSSPP